jgi:hypothetical protein
MCRPGLSPGKYIEEMSNNPSLTFFASATVGSIDTAKGVIRGISVISEGPVLGHDKYVDAQTLKTVLSSASEYSGGLKVKLNHGSDVGSIVGYLDSFRIEGTQLRADFHLLKSSEHSNYVLELASTVPEQIGMSIAFSFETEEIDGLPYPAVRCVEIYSCDLVDSPAANAGGLFSTKMSETTANPEKTAAATEEPSLESRMAALEATLASFTTKLDALASLAALPTQLSAIETVVNGFSRLVEEQKEAFEKRVTTQAAEFTSQLKDANVLAARKLAATGIPAGKAPPAEGGEKILDFQSAMIELKDPLEQLAFYHKNKAKIQAQFSSPRR